MGGLADSTDQCFRGVARNTPERSGPRPPTHDSPCGAGADAADCQPCTASVSPGPCWSAWAGEYLGPDAPARQAGTTLLTA